MEIQPVHKATVLRLVREKGIWKGYITPNKINSAHVVDGWHLGSEIEIHSDKNLDGTQLYHVYNVDENGIFIPRNLQEVLNQFQTYNCNSELGNSIRFWEVR